MSRSWLGLYAFFAFISLGWADEKAPNSLTLLVAERLSWMDEVAEVKRAKAAPISDPVREEVLLQAMEKQGKEAGLPPERVRQFFACQILAAKAFQEDWLSRPKPESWRDRPLPDLTTEVRPRLDDIGHRMIAALVHSRQSGDAGLIVRHTRDALQQQGYAEVVIDYVIQGVKAGLSP
ncbi:chorismate mutase-like protein [Prosthecobacter dejongeii]|uniref:chorismate mutase n=1 Tax=Prosthecobacter dejongeii TaxID=48465 RepID=A0A7W7YIR8_9BACT|nr:chorismate mutase-like protein [Prosthecobacter dejongeii]